MTTDIRVGPVSQVDDASFRTWGSRMSAAYAAVGLVKGTDTGQIDWSTVVKPSTGTQSGFEIWRFNDSLQATKPIYLRIGFGAGTNGSYPAIWITIGKGSDGVGNITGVMLAATQISAGNAISTSTNWYTSSLDGSALLCAPALAGQTAAITWWWIIDRSRDTTGAPTGTGLVFIRSAAATVTCTGHNYNAANTWSHNRIPVCVPSTNADLSLAAGGKPPLFGAVVSDGVGTIWQPRSVLVGMRSDVGAGILTVPGYGTYLPLGVAGQQAESTASAWTVACLGWW